MGLNLEGMRGEVLVVLADKLVKDKPQHKRLHLLDLLLLHRLNKLQNLSLLLVVHLLLMLLVVELLQKEKLAYHVIYHVCSFHLPAVR
jgi:hypothetical protein